MPKNITDFEAVILSLIVSKTELRVQDVVAAAGVSRSDERNRKAISRQIS